MTYELAVLMVSTLAGGVASVAGFGIGSLITPLLSLAVGTKTAVIIVSFPHFIGTAIRFFMLKSHVDKKVLLGFGTMSAIGGLTGALLQAYFAVPALTLVFGVILIFAGIMGATGLVQKMHFRGTTAWIAGGISGVLGGLVGNQGGIRSAALLGFNISKEAFIATATAIGLIVDISRMPVYIFSEPQAILDSRKWILLSSIGVMAGTLLGTKYLKKIPEQKFKRMVSFIILSLGVFLLIRHFI